MYWREQMARYYSGPQQGFALEPPATWQQVAIATILAIVYCHLLCYITVFFQVVCWNTFTCCGVVHKWEFRWGAFEGCELHPKTVPCQLSKMIVCLCPDNFSALLVFHEMKGVENCCCLSSYCRFWWKTHVKILMALGFAQVWIWKYEKAVYDFF